MTEPIDDPSMIERDAMALRQDIGTRDAVRRVLDAAVAVDLSQVGIRVEDGMVTLVGTVAEEDARVLAVRLAAGVPGVPRVVDLLLVADEHAAIAQTRAVDAESRLGSSRGASPQETGLVPSAEDPAGPWEGQDDPATR